MKNKALIITLCALILAVCLFFSGYAGYIVGSKSCNTAAPTAPDGISSQTFYAEIKEINGSSLLVGGLEVNDINFRGEFTFLVSKDTRLEWRYTEIALAELEAGDTVSITFTGEIQESYPAVIRDIVKIQLLDDEK